MTEAAESLGIEDQVSDYWTEILRLNKTIKERRDAVSCLKDRKAAFNEKLDQIDEAWDLWEELSEKLSGGEPVYAPSTSRSTKKRKRHSQPGGSRKDRMSLDSDVEIESDDGSETSEKENSENDTRTIVTEEDIDAKLAALKAEKKLAREGKRAVETELTAQREDIGSITQTRDALEAKVKAICIKGRNDYSRGAIKQDFAMGIKE